MHQAADAQACGDVGKLAAAAATNGLPHQRRNNVLAMMKMPLESRDTTSCIQYLMAVAYRRNGRVHRNASSTTRKILQLNGVA